MAAWSSFDDDWYDRDESFGQHVQIDAFYPDLTLADIEPPEASAHELCALIDRAAAEADVLADELANLTARARRIA